MSDWPSSSVAPAALTGLPSWAMARLSRIGRSWLEDQLAKRDLTLADYATIEAVALGTNQSQREISASAGYDPSDIVMILDRLQDLAIVKREPDPRDRRRHVVKLTRRGHTTLHLCRKLADDAAERLLAPLAPNDAVQFRRALELLLRAHNP